MESSERRRREHKRARVDVRVSELTPKLREQLRLRLIFASIVMSTIHLINRTISATSLS